MEISNHDLVTKMMARTPALEKAQVHFADQNDKLTATFIGHALEVYFASIVLRPALFGETFSPKRLERRLGKLNPIGRRAFFLAR